MIKFDFKKAKRAQELLRERVELKPLEVNPRLIGGCDLTFLNPYRNPTLGIGAFVVLKYPEMEVVEKRYEVMEVEIPYYPGFLAFRELPLLLKTFRKLKNKPNLIIVDGHGIAHPRGLGIAAHFGVVEKVPTIGCAKKLLYGKTEEPCSEKGCYEPIVEPKTGKTIGYTLRTRRGVKPVFVSAGNLITNEEAREWVLKLATKYRLPEPTRLAHNYLQEVRKGIISKNFPSRREKNGS
ncbi:endonuclease V [Thermovibrio sp.]